MRTSEYSGMRPPYRHAAGKRGPAGAVPRQGGMPAAQAVCLRPEGDHPVFLDGRGAVFEILGRGVGGRMVGMAVRMETLTDRPL